MSPFYIACPMCGRGSVEGRVCAPCRLEADPTPLSAWLAAHELRLVDVVESSGVTERTLKRVLHGDRVSRDVANAVAAATGLDANEIRRGVERNEDG